MERTYRASNTVYAYAFLLVVTALLLGFEAAHRFRLGAVAWGVFLASLAVAWLACAGLLVYRWGRLRVVVRPDMLTVSGLGPERRVHWEDVDRVREIRGPAYQLSLRHLLPGPYLPHGLLRGETVLEIVARPAMRIVFRQALVQSFPALQQDVVRSVPRDTEVDLHFRWWRE